ncbi:hypothetical protein [Mesorhizobium sp. KR2-14]|uniref:hypothetical protein n=1 Tax=Mesorhizobium sp. KR2-14 TaxID=3156610 RepID=UPI0032B4CCDB
MRTYLSTNPHQRGNLAPEELDLLDKLIRRAAEALHIDDPADRNEVAARVLSLYTLGGRSEEDILELTIRLHREGFAPGGRRSDSPPPKRIRTERQRRRLTEEDKSAGAAPARQDRQALER